MGATAVKCNLKKPLVTVGGLAHSLVGLTDCVGVSSATL